METKSGIYEDLKENLSAETANDPYLLNSISNINEQLSSAYISLITDSLKAEDDAILRPFLVDMLDCIKNNKPVSNSQKTMLRGYFKYKYDKSAELFQIEKWLRDFEANKGFSITGSLVTFRPDYIKDKTPIELINQVGESLKKGKEIRKGRGYYDKI